jgi:putative transposase
MQPPILTLDENTLKDEIRDLVRRTVEEAVNGILDAQADELASAERYERTDERQAHGSGHYSRGPPAQAGKIEAGVPKPGGVRLATEAVERHGRRESSVEEALMETCLLGVSTRNIEDVTRILWDEGLSAGTASNPDQEASEKVDAWRRRPLASERPYACVDGTHARRNWGGAHEGVALLAAIGADPDGRREAVCVEEGHGESEDPWREFLLGPGDRGLAGAGPAAGDKSAGMLGAPSEAFPSAECQRCTVHSCRNVLAKVPKRRRKAVAAQPEATRAQESLEASARKAKEVAGSPGTSGLADAARVVEEGYMETPAYARFPPEHWRRIRTNNGIERLNREIKRRTKAVASFPDGRAATMLAAARCKYMAEGSWGTKRYLDVSLLEGWDVRGSAEG